LDLVKMFLCSCAIRNSYLSFLLSYLSGTLIGDWITVLLPALILMMFCWRASSLSLNADPISPREMQTFKGSLFIQMSCTCTIFILAINGYSSVGMLHQAFGIFLIIMALINIRLRHYMVIYACI
jgi:hypothetical protein